MINPRQIRILIVDDEPSIRELLSARFSIFGYQVASAANGAEAWQMLTVDPSIKIVISDLSMPVMDGQALLVKCKSVNADFPRFFVITGQAQWTEEQLLACGAEGVLQKPFDARNLLNVTRHSLLTLTERLRYPPYAPVSGTVRAQFASLTSAEASGRFALGRGGAFLVSPTPMGEPGQLMQLEIDLGDFIISGSAYLRWRRVQAGEHLAGFEFAHLKTESVQAFQSWLSSNPVATYIPSPQIVSSMPSKAKLQSTG